MRVLSAVRALPLLLLAAFALQERPVALHLAGDSTLAPKRASRRPETGWGERLQEHFDPDRVRVVNHGRNGRSTRTFLDEGRWRGLVDELRPGDFVFIQFGHNDGSPEKADRYTPPADYRRNLARMVAEARARGAVPVLMTPVARRRFDAEGRFYDTHGEYPGLVRAVAAELRVPLVDMHRASERVLRERGAEGSKRLFLHLAPGESPNYPQGLTDDTHFSPLGAEVMASLAIDGIRALGLPVAAHLDSPSPATSSSAAPDTLLSAARIAALPAAERAAWEAYLERSRRDAARDRAAMEAELRAAGKTAPEPAPAGRGFEVTRAMTEAWFRTDTARRLADVLVTYQTPGGGWSKRIDFTRPRRPGESWASEAGWIATLDNGATTSQLVFLARAFAAHGDPRHRASFERGVEYLLAAQQPTGCWPQVYPLRGGYHDAATFNDDATIHALEVLRDAAAGEPSLVPAETRARAAGAVERGVGCILATQVRVGGRRTVWGAQHDPIGFAPVKARAYEHASLSGRESAAILDFLMRIENPSPEVVEAVHAAAAWFRESAIRGYRYAPRGELVADSAAGPLWARFHEIGTDRPLFSDRDGVVRYSLSEIGEERRRGYLWYTDEPAATLRRYDRWAARRPVIERQRQDSHRGHRGHRGTPSRSAAPPCPLCPL
ncbi:MAG TPA: pectate lyase [Longimicrobium sp.]|nr:pectate lyase [Longimicrobium sp.]